MVRRFDGDNCSKLYTYEKFKNHRIARFFLNASKAVSVGETLNKGWIVNEPLLQASPVPIFVLDLHYCILSKYVEHHSVAWLPQFS